VGLDTMSECFARLHLATQVGCAPSALRGGMHTLEAARLETTGTWEHEGGASGAGREGLAAVDEPCLERLLLVCMDLATGSLLLAEVADDRTSTTWQAVVEERLKSLSTGGLAMGRDRAKALIQLAAQGLTCLSMPDFCHVVPEIVKSYALAIGQRGRRAHQEVQKAQEALARRHAQRQAAQETSEAQALVAARYAEGRRWEEVHHTYRRH
jgi:hypothetical protein